MADDMTGRHDTDTPATDAVADDSSAPPPTFQEAFAAARDEHSKAAKANEHAPGTEASTDDDKDPETPPARTGKAAPAPASTAKTTKAAAESGLLTDEEFSALQTKYPNDPAKLRRELEATFTKKTQALAAERRSTERLGQYTELIDAFEEDPEATIVALAKQHGISLAAKAGETPAGEADATETGVEAILADFKESLGPELEYLADGLAPAITKLVEKLTATTVEKQTAPLKQQTDTLLNKAATEQTDLVMKTLGERHPDWKDHEEAMFELSQKLAPNGLTEGEYLDHLYTLVTAKGATETSEAAIEAKVAAQVKARLEKMRKGAEETEPKTDATPDRSVRSAAPELPTFREAYEAAKRGERYA